MRTEEERKEYQKNWREEHKKYRKEYAKQWHKEQPDYQKNRRHKLGISKKFGSGRWKDKRLLLSDGEKKEYRRNYIKKWRKEHPEETKRRRQRRRDIIKKGGELSVQTIQMVYEDNIKKYGTLTCIYCLNPIAFGNDSLEHKQPITRSGTNEYKNLGIACRKCNIQKNNKTENEYREYLEKKITEGGK